MVPSKQSLLIFRKFHLRTTLVVPFILQIITAVGLVGYLSFRSSQKAVNDLATQLRSELTARIEGELKQYLGSPHDFNQLNGAAFSEGSFDMVNASNGKQFLTQVQISPFVYSSYCGDSQGQYLGAYRLFYQGSSTIAMSVSNAQTNNHFYFYAMDSRGNRRELLQKLKPYDPRKRPWYIAAVKAKRSIWSEVYLDFASGLPTITASEPVYDLTGKILGVCATDVVVLEDLRKFLASLPIGQTGQAFIVDRSGSMISSSTDEPLTVGKGENSRLITAIESSEPLVQATAQHLQQKFGNFKQIQRSQQWDFSLKGERHFIQILPLNDGKGIDWLIAVVVPESDFMGQIYTNTRNTILLTLAALVLAIIIGILTARKLTHPILQIAEAAQDMANGNLNQNVASSWIIELEKLANSFNSMAGQLKESFQALSQAEENYRSIFENAFEGIFQSSADGKLLNANPAMARIFGYNSAEQMMASITDLRTQIYVDPAERDEFHRLMQQHGQVNHFEFQAQRQDSSKIWAEIHAREVKDNNGQVLYYEGIIQDITERKRQKEILEAMVKERTAQLEGANAEILGLNEKLKTENLRMGAELDILREMQQLILPKREELEAIAGLEIVGFMEPADEVGGDYYDVLNHEGVATIAIGDVTGHGLESGILMVMVQTAVRTLKEIREVDPVRFLDTLNRTIYQNVQRMNSDKNLTLAVLNYTEGQVSISGQHEEILLVRANGKVELVNTMDLGFPIGLDEEIADFINHTSIQLNSGDGIVLYTDGITEAKDIHKKQYGLPRLCEVVSQYWQYSAEKIKNAVIEDLRRHIGEQKVFDDITLLVLKQK